MNIIPQDALNIATRLAITSGIRVFQGARMAETDAAHVSKLLDFMDPPPRAVIVDAGCGIGEVARLMREERADLNFILLNNNAMQLGLAPAGMTALLADMHDIPLSGGSVDGIMFCYALCHADFDLALAEAARIVRHGGFLFVYDYERIGGTNDLFAERLYATAISVHAMSEIARRHGWSIHNHVNPLADDSLFRAAYNNDDEYDKIFADLRLTMWRAERR